jgi:PhnB protein
MTSRLNPYLTFAGTAREAMEFYRSALGGDLVMNTFADFGNSGPDGDKIMHANLETPDGLTLMASDTAPGTEASTGSAVAVSLSGDDTEKLRACWNRLTEGAEVTMPLERQMWGDEFGQFTDRFGVPWLINIAGAAEE